MIGAGVVGLSVAWLLVRQGHRVVLLDPDLERGQSDTAGSSAALGLLMAQIYRRSSGRGWRLRQQSLALWQEWRQELEQRGHVLPFRPGLLQLATSEQELQAQQRLAEQRQQQGLPLRLLSQEELQALQPALPHGSLGGLLSERDGQLDPIAAMTALRRDGNQHGLEIRSETALRLERGVNDADQRWLVHGSGGTRLSCHWLVLSAGLGSPALLEPLGHDRPQSPVLGQALELELPAGCTDATAWPGSLSWGGINLVPRPQRRLWLGATVEPGCRQGEASALAELRQLGGAAPDWLRQATVLRQWQGLRARPENRPAPLLEELEPGLLLNSGHYRNGVLLAPACAAWVSAQIAAGMGR